MTRVALIHALRHSPPPIETAFRAEWPTARLMNLLDDSLSADLARDGALTPAMTERFLTLARYAAGTGAEGHTVIDTTAWVQQRTVESVDSIARRLTDAGQRLIPLTDLSNGRIYLAADRIVLVRDSGDRHAATARAAIVMVGLRFNTDVAVRESVEDVLAALGR